MLLLYWERQWFKIGRISANCNRRKTGRFMGILTLLNEDFLADVIELEQKYLSYNYVTKIT